MKKLVPLPTNNPRRVKNKLYICGLLPTVMREEVIKTFAGYGKLQEVILFNLLFFYYIIIYYYFFIIYRSSCFIINTLFVFKGLILL